jgi:hypothetical protein
MVTSNNEWFVRAWHDGVYIWLMDSTTVTATESPGTLSDLNWQIFGVGDFNADG